MSSNCDRDFSLEVHCLTNYESRQIFKSNMYIVFSVAQKVRNFSDQKSGEIYFMK